MDVLIVSSPPKLKKEVEFTIDWAIRAIVRLGGYAGTSLKKSDINRVRQS